MKLFTIGFTKKSAEQFFTSLTNAGVKRLIDIRLNNVSQLAGFTKKEDLRYFTKAICHIDYHHLPDLAPTKEILDAFKEHENPLDELAEAIVSSQETYLKRSDAQKRGKTLASLDDIWKAMPPAENDQLKEEVSS